MVRSSDGTLGYELRWIKDAGGIFWCLGSQPVKEQSKTLSYLCLERRPLERLRYV
jgi:hypothetical protein